MVRISTWIFPHPAVPAARLHTLREALLQFGSRLNRTAAPAPVRARPSLPPFRHDSDSIQTAACNAALARLRGAQDFAGFPITVDLQNGALTLRGRVPTYFLKHRAALVVREIDPTASVDNRIEVMPLPHSAVPCDRHRAVTHDAAHRSD